MIVFLSHPPKYRVNIRKQLGCVLFEWREGKNQTPRCFVSDCNCYEEECQRKRVRNAGEDLKSERAIKRTQ